MSDSTLDNDDLTPTQEYVIAGGVILLFGLLYWSLNQGGNPAAEMALGSAPLPKASFALANPAVTPPALAPQAVVAATTTAPIPPEAALPKATITAPKPAEATVKPAALPAAPPATPPPAPVAQTQVPQAAYTLPDGTAVNIAPHSAEAAFGETLLSGEHNKPITLGDIRFDPSSSNIKAESDHQIRAIAALLHKYPTVRILIRGHTDETGDPNNNTQLSLMRANAMGVALVNLGVERRRISIMGMGNAAPLDTNATEAGRSKNRRIDVSITD